MQDIHINAPLFCPADSSLPLSCGSMVASVFENGFAGALLGDCTTSGAFRLFLEPPAMPRTPVSSLFPDITLSVSSRLWEKPAGDTGGGEPA